MFCRVANQFKAIVQRTRIRNMILYTGGAITIIEVLAYAYRGKAKEQLSKQAADLTMRTLTNKEV